MKMTGKKLLALSLTAALMVSTVSIQDYTKNSTVEAASTRVGDEGCKEIPGTKSSFDDYNQSFLSVTGYASDGVNDRSADLNTSKHRQVRTAEELGQAIRDAKRGATYNSKGEVVSPESHDSVTIIEIMNDIDIGTIPINCTSTCPTNCMDNYSDVFKEDGLKSGAKLTHKAKNFPGVTILSLDDIDGLTIFSKNGSTIKHCQFQIGSGGTNGTGSNDIVIRNLRFDGLWQWDNTGKQKDAGWAFMKIYKSSNIWIDHCTFTIAFDGNVDLESGSNGVTISWCKFGLSAEEAKQEDSVVYSSISYMEEKLQDKLEDYTWDELVANKKVYEPIKKQVEDLKYDVTDEESLKKLKANEPELYESYTEAASNYVSIVKFNNGTMYADMRLEGATPEEIMEYAAYHSKVHLTGSGDREFKDMDNADGSITKDGNDRLQITLAYDSYQNVGQRIPMVRMGVGHMYNCYIDNKEHSDVLNKYPAVKKYAKYTLSRAINARDGASIAADTCVFYGFDEPLVGEEVQGDDISNINYPWDSLYSTAINHALIVNSRTTNTSGETDEGSSWDNGGVNLFTKNGASFKYTDLTLKKWSWNSTITHLGDTPISEVSRNAMTKEGWEKLPYMVPQTNADGSAKINKNKNVMYEPFKWTYSDPAEDGLPYEYQLIELDKVKEVVTSKSGAGVIQFADANDWVKTVYEKEEAGTGSGDQNDTSGGAVKPTPDVSGSGATPTPTPTPDVSGSGATPTPTPDVNNTATPTPTPDVNNTENPTPTPDVSGSGATPTPTPEPSTGDAVAVKLGDVDNSGKVDLKDAQQALRGALKITTLDEAAEKAADVNGNGTVGLDDVQTILKVALKIIDDFPKAETASVSIMEYICKTVCARIEEII